MKERLLTQNSELKELGVYAWTLPAHIVELDEGRRFNTCPKAGICAAFCYAKHGRFRHSHVYRAHKRKLLMVLNDLEGWRARMEDELKEARYAGKMIRIHDGGDFFSEEYARAWIGIARTHPDKTFYAYTKEVSLFRRLRRPQNFVVIFSYGGREDHLIRRSRDRHADVFHSLEALLAAGYTPIDEDDRLAALSPSNRIGIVSNNLPHLRRKQGAKSFSEWQTKKSPSTSARDRSKTRSSTKPSAASGFRLASSATADACAQFTSLAPS